MAKPYGERDAGFDLYCEERSLREFVCGEKINQNVVAALYDTDRQIFRAYWMLPRSSISKTSMRLANSVGLIDAGYRGNIMAAVDTSSNESIGLGDRYFQLSSPDLLPFDRIEIVEEIPGGPTLRGTGGFGSTGN
jgi:dUTP pyrophosphatase